jgi:hypothetical protein
MGDQKENMQKPGQGSSDPSKQHEGINKGSETSQPGERAGQSQHDKPGIQNPGNRDTPEKDRASNPKPDQGEKNREGSTKPGGTAGNEADRSR